MVEFALALSVLLMMMMGILEGARWVSTYAALANAAADGARAGAYLPTSTWTVSAIDSRVRSAARTVLPAWITLADADITVCRRTATATSCTAPGLTTGLTSGAVIEVTVVYAFHWVPAASGLLGTADTTITVHDSARID
jgi:Flp pilus assembly protein TadG